MKKNFSSIIPVYNKRLESVPALVEHGNNKEVEWIVCDNSTLSKIKLNNALYARKNKITYIDMEGNKGISRAYNAAVRIANAGIVCIFDHDTMIPSEYFDKVKSKIDANGRGIYIPRVYTSVRLVSPLRFFGCAILTYGNTSRVDLKRCSAFNSGMAITRDVFDQIAYDESLFLEWVDHAFCRDAHRAGIPFFYLEDLCLQQDWSRENSDLRNALIREKIQRRDLLNFYSNGMVEKIYGRLYAAYRVLRLSIQYKTTAFITNK